MIIKNLFLIFVFCILLKYYNRSHYLIRPVHIMQRILIAHVSIEMLCDLMRKRRRSWKKFVQDYRSLEIWVWLQVSAYSPWPTHMDKVGYFSHGSVRAVDFWQQRGMTRWDQPFIVEWYIALEWDLFNFVFSAINLLLILACCHIQPSCRNCRSNPFARHVLLLRMG